MTSFVLRPRPLELTRVKATFFTKSLLRDSLFLYVICMYAKRTGKLHFYLSSSTMSKLYTMHDIHVIFIYQPRHNMQLICESANYFGAYK